MNVKWQPQALGMAASAMLLLNLSSASAASITILDLTDGSPLVTTDLADKSIDLAPEVAFISGNLSPPAVPPGIRSVILLEPPEDPFGPRASDFLTLDVGEVMQDPAGGPPFRPIKVTFMSDGAPGFDQAVAALPTGTPTVDEDGTIQDVTHLLMSTPGNLDIFVQSDFKSSEVPDSGSTISLLGLALATLLVVARCASKGERVTI